MRFDRRNETLSIVYQPPTKENTLFLDRDGVLNEVVMRGDEISSPRSIDEFQLANDLAFLGSERFTQHWNLVVVTNQPDLSRGLISFDLVQLLMQRIRTFVPICAVFICPHTGSANCDCRKPKAGMIREYRRRFARAGTDYLIGDRETDAMCAASENVLFVKINQPHNLNWNYAGPSINSFLELENVLAIPNNECLT